MSCSTLIPVPSWRAVAAAGLWIAALAPGVAQGQSPTPVNRLEPEATFAPSLPQVPEDAGSSPYISLSDPDSSGGAALCVRNQFALANPTASDAEPSR
jgi:hypothetical protein